MTRLEELRRERGWSRRQLAEITEISARTIESYEQGLRDIRVARIDLVLKLAQALEVEPEEIIGGIE